MDDLLERERDLDALEALVAGALGGDGRLGLVEGPAGIGKTRLLAAARALAADAGMRCLTARGGELERAFPFGVVRQLYEPALAGAPPAERSELFAGPAGLVEHLVAGHGDSPAADPAGPFALYHGLYWLTANLSVGGPLALFVDDLHWCDPPSLAALEYVCRRLEGLPVLVVAASRAHEPGFDRGVLDELGREPAASVVEPRALTAGATAALVRSRLAPTAADAFCAACHDATGGNPLLVAELATALAAEGVAGGDADVARVAEIGPEAVARAVRLRLARLPEEARALARAASVLGDGALLEDAAATAGLAPAEAAAAASALVEVELLRARDTVAFVHPVVRGAVHASLGPLEQREAHARAARHLAAAGRPPEQIAAHILECQPAAEERVVDILRVAAGRSLADGCAALAAAYLQRALDEPPPAECRADVLFELGAAEQLVHGPHAAEHLREALALTDDPARRAAIALGLGNALYFAGRTLDARDVFEEALADPALDAASTRRLETGLVVLGLFEPQLVPLARGRLAGFDLDAPADDTAARTLVAYGAYDDARSLGDRELAVERTRRVIADRSILVEESQGAWAAAAGTLSAADRLDEAQRLAEGVTRAGEESGSLFMACSGLAMQAGIFHRLGELADAEAYGTAAIETATAHGFFTVSNWAGGRHALVLVDRGEGEAAFETLRGLGVDGPLPDSVHLYETRFARGCAHVACGRLREGADDLRAVGRLWDGIGARNPDAAPWRVQLAHVLVLLGELDEARALAAEQVALARQWGAARPLAAALRVHGLALGDESLLRESVEVARTSPGRLELALSLVELGSAERRANRRSAAREPLEEGLALAHRCGARGLEKRALEELLATGARPRRAPASGRDALTPSELRVAEMAASGQTNREIAQRLFVTQKTVEAHLARTFRKLRVDSRVQLAGALSR